MWAPQTLKVVLLVSSCALERLSRRARDQPEARMQNGINKLTGFLQDEISEPTFSAEEYMSQYTAVYNMCTQRAPHEYSEKLYERYKGAFTDYLGDRVRSRPGSSCSSLGVPCRSLRAAAYMPHVKSRVQLHLKQSAAGAQQAMRHSAATASSSVQYAGATKGAEARERSALAAVPEGSLGKSRGHGPLAVALLQLSRQVRSLYSPCFAKGATPQAGQLRSLGTRGVGAS